MGLPYQETHQHDISHQRNRAIPQVEAQQPRQRLPDLRPPAVAPRESLMPDEVVCHRRFHCQNRADQIIQVPRTGKREQNAQLHPDANNPDETELQPAHKAVHHDPTAALTPVPRDRAARCAKSRKR